MPGRCDSLFSSQAYASSPSDWIPASRQSDPDEARTEPRDVEEALHRLRHLDARPVQRGERAGVHRGVDLGGDRLADPGERLELAARGDDGERLGVLARRLGEGAVRAGLEWVLAANLEEIGQLGEEARDVGVVH